MDAALLNQPLMVRVLVGVGCLITVATAFSIPGGADPSDDNFIDALSHAGIEYGEPGNAMAVGQSICPMLAAAWRQLRRRGVGRRAPRHVAAGGPDVHHHRDPDLLPGRDGKPDGRQPGRPDPGITGIPGV